MKRVHGEVQGERRAVFEAVFSLVRAIPRARVLTYGRIATLLLNRLSPRAVGWALHGCPRDVPWHRVVNASGGCSTERMPDIPPGLQRAMLEAEGVAFSAAGKIDLERWLWRPPGGRGGSGGPRPRRLRAPAGASRGRRGRIR